MNALALWWVSHSLLPSLFSLLSTASTRVQQSPWSEWQEGRRRCSDAQVPSFNVRPRLQTAKRACPWSAIRALPQHGHWDWCKGAGTSTVCWNPVSPNAEITMVRKSASTSENKKRYSSRTHHRSAWRGARFCAHDSTRWHTSVMKLELFLKRCSSDIIIVKQEWCRAWQERLH